MSAFDPTEHLINLEPDPRKPKRMYLEAKWRLAWLRAEHPEAIIHTEIIAYDVQQAWAIVRAIVTIPGGGSAVGTVYQTPTGIAKDYIANGETSAISRALGALGYGTQFATEFDQPDQLADSPVPVKPPPPTARELSGQPEAKAPAKPAAAAPVVANANAEAKRAATEAGAVKAALIQRLKVAVKVKSHDEKGLADTVREVFSVTRWGDLTPDQLEQVIGYVEDTYELRYDGPNGTARLAVIGPDDGRLSVDDLAFEAPAEAAG